MLAGGHDSEDEENGADDTMLQYDSEVGEDRTGHENDE